LILNDNEFDAIVVGTGPGGATAARELSRRGKRVLMLERGGHAPRKESLFATAPLLNVVSVGDKLGTTRAITTGGTTAVYFAVAHVPPLETFRALGVDLTDAFEEAKSELPLAPLPDAFVGAQTKRMRDSAMQLGHPWVKRLMLVDQSKCPSGYTYESKWTAGRYVQDAESHGAMLVTRARVRKVLTEGKRAIGVEYTIEKDQTRQAFATKIILAAGATATPLILRDSGVHNVANRGFCVHPNVAVFGSVPGLNAGETFAGCEGADFEDDMSVGDANLGSTIYRMFMVGGGRLLRAFQHSRSVALGVMVRDEPGGELRDDGRYRKEISKRDLDRVEKGLAIARDIIRNAGGRNIFHTQVAAGHVTGAIRINDHVDSDLQTECENLHVCDGSLIPETTAVSPTLTLVCMGKYLAARLAPAL
jgi:choline dehydrogenase-like flavoprotein